MKRMKTVSVSDWNPSVPCDDAKEYVQSLESGMVLYFPSLSFSIEEKEKAIFSPNLVQGRRKNISYDLGQDRLKGCEGSTDEREIIHKMMKRFASSSEGFVRALFPHYKEELILARTSFRPVEIKGRKNASSKKDDTQLHIDSFPSTPTQGKRILRFFANVNPYEIPRVWKLGESYKSVIKRFIPKVKAPVLGSRKLLNRLGVTKSYRILYDHYMLNIHDKMKFDEFYQNNVDQEIIEFAPLTCWIAYTDQVSHAVLSGQYAFEQSFYLPVDAQESPDKSPLAYMEKLLQKNLKL